MKALIPPYLTHCQSGRKTEQLCTEFFCIVFFSSGYTGNKKIRNGGNTMAKMIFKASTKAKNGLTIECSARNFNMILDEPESLGGNDEGMNPVECLLVALGGCKCIVAKAFANKNRINLQDIRIELDGVLDPDGFLGKNKDAKIGFSKITTRFYIKADNTKEEIEKFVDFIEKTCPVHDTLENTPEFSTEIYTE